MAKAGIIGAGSWGCALAGVLDTNGHQVTVWSVMEDEISMLKETHEHADKLPGVLLSEKISFTCDQRSGFGHGSFGPCRTLRLYKEYGKTDGALHQAEPDHCERGKRNRRREPADAL